MPKGLYIAKVLRLNRVGWPKSYPACVNVRCNIVYSGTNVH